MKCKDGNSCDQCELNTAYVKDDNACQAIIVCKPNSPDLEYWSNNDCNKISCPDRCDKAAALENKCATCAATAWTNVKTGCCDVKPTCDATN